MDNRREKIIIEGVPGTWTTNLDDDDVRTFHAEHHGDIEDSDAIKVGVFDRELRITYRDRMVPFKDGACRWIVLNDQNWLIYRTTLEWEVWMARKEEIDELQDEQERERAATALLLRTESDHQMSLARTAVHGKDWATAERHLLARADLVAEAKRHNVMNWWTYTIFESVSNWFASFPSLQNGVEFLKKYNCYAPQFLAYANHAAFGRRLPDEALEREIEKVFDAAIELFPADGNLCKQICLFWRRHHRRDLAIKFCEGAIERGITDDTKSGFVGRLNRLKQEQSHLNGIKHSTPSEGIG